MRWRIRIVLFIVALIVEIPLFKMGIEPVYVFISAFFIIFIGYTSWLMIKTKRIVNLLEVGCDPLRFLDEYDKYKQISKRESFQNGCNINIAVGLISLGRYDESLAILKDIKLPARSSKLLTAAYNLALLDNYLSVGEVDAAAAAYDSLKSVRGKLYNRRIEFAVDSGAAWYLYEINKTTETARYYLMQLEYLCTAYSKKIGKRQKLAALYARAELHETLGERDEAAKKYASIAEHGNRLYIAQMSNIKMNE